MPLASKARRTWSRVDSYTSSPLSDSRRFNAVSDTRALSASVSCVQPSNARAARDCRAVILHDHLPLGPTPPPDLRLYWSFSLGKTSASRSPRLPPASPQGGDSPPPQPFVTARNVRVGR